MWLTDREAEKQSAVVRQVYLVWSEAQGPQGSIMSVHSLQEASWGQLKDLQLPALTENNKTQWTQTLTSKDFTQQF